MKNDRNFVDAITDLQVMLRRLISLPKRFRRFWILEQAFDNLARGRGPLSTLAMLKTFIELDKDSSYEARFLEGHCFFLLKDFDSMSKSFSRGKYLLDNTKRNLSQIDRDYLNLYGIIHFKDHWHLSPFEKEIPNVKNKKHVSRKYRQQFPMID